MGLASLKSKENAVHLKKNKNLPCAVIPHGRDLKPDPPSAVHSRPAATRDRRCGVCRGSIRAEVVREAAGMAAQAYSDSETRGWAGVAFSDPVADCFVYLPPFPSFL